LLAELRLIRAMQVQVNQRTVLYGKKYDGEQTSDPIIQAELRQLSQRQVKLQDMIHKIATQANQ
jgi:FKBP-type peptidyl-prolyl cis-trans isomerase (trigger factor)